MQNGSPYWPQRRETSDGGVWFSVTDEGKQALTAYLESLKDRNWHERKGTYNDGH